MTVSTDLPRQRLKLRKRQKKLKKIWLRKTLLFQMFPKKKPGELLHLLILPPLFSRMEQGVWDFPEKEQCNSRKNSTKRGLLHTIERILCKSRKALEG